VWTIWLIKFYFSRKYEHFESNYDGKVSVIIPVFKEDLRIFAKCLHSVRKQSKETELIVVIDGGDKDIEYIAKKYADKVMSYEWRGKRPSIVDGFKAATGDILILMDSDSYYDSENGIAELIKPFADSYTGGVTSRQKIYDQKGNIIRRFAGWMEDIRFAVGHPSQSYFGGVGCLPGRAIAIRKKYIMDHLDEFLNDYFMGEKSVISDDRALTGYLMRDGYKTLYQSTSLVYTDCPNEWKKFVKQQLRWSRGSQRETIRNIHWLIKRNKYTSMCFITDIITPLLFVSVLFDMLVRYYIGIDNLYGIPFYLSVILGSVGMTFSLGVRQSFPLKYSLKDFAYLPLYCIFLTFVQTPVRLYGLMTIYEQGWMTRVKER
jgi:hyaluronan synthase